MGSCCSKKMDSTVSATVNKSESTEPETKKSAEEPKTQQESQPETVVKKEIFVIKHRKSHDTSAAVVSDPDVSQNRQEIPKTSNNVNVTSTSTCSGSTNNTMIRTSSCTKEEVDAILIQCGRLSRSNSSGKAPKYSGSKRSYDFDHHDNDQDDSLLDSNSKKGIDFTGGDDERGLHRHRQSGRSSSHGRRRTPSREREQQHQRSGSRERSSGSGRRLSRSPGRRSEPTTTSTNNATANSNAGNRPGKMVSVPPTVMDKSNNAEVTTITTKSNNGVKRISVKRNVGEAMLVAGSRSAASPRSQSPARTNANSNAKGSNENQQQPSLSRSSSRKAEQSPYRRNPLNEIDTNSLAYPHSATNRNAQKSKETEAEGLSVKEPHSNLHNQAPTHKNNTEMYNERGSNYKSGSKSALNNQGTAKVQQKNVEEPSTTNVSVCVTESLKPQTLTRSRSSRRSRDLDINPETLLNSNPSYTTLLLEDIQNFHQKNIPTTTFSLPPCLTKACSILEAVADLNSSTSSNPCSAFSEDRTDKSRKNCSQFSSGAKKTSELKDPFVESEVLVNDDLTEPSFHKYVTVKRGGGVGGAVDMEEQESSGSNSFVGGGQQHWGFSSADSTDCWTSTSNTSEQEWDPLGFQRHNNSAESGRRGFSGKKRDSEYQQTRIGRGRAGAGKSLQSNPVVAATASM